jgi:hypothetical protein
MEVSITPDHMTQRHGFQFNIDQSYLLPFIKQCQSLLEATYAISLAVEMAASRA